MHPRVGQLDASILDAELAELLRTQLKACFRYLRPDIIDKYESELMLVLKAALFKLTVWDHSTTYGAHLQSLSFVDARSGRLLRPASTRQKLAYGLWVVFGTYGWKKLQTYLTLHDYEPSSLAVRNVADSLDLIWSASSLFNFVAFLYNGRYSTLILRLLRMKLAPTSRKVSRVVNFEFQNRQLVWNALTEFLLFLLPLLNLPRLRRLVARALAGLSRQTNQNKRAPGGELGFLPGRTCAVCYKDSNSYTDVTMPYRAEPCGHLYCYVCITSKLVEAEGDGWDCLRCGELVKSCTLYEDMAHE